MDRKDRIPVGAILVLCAGCVRPTPVVPGEMGEVGGTVPDEPVIEVVPVPEPSTELDAALSEPPLSARARDARGDERLFAGRFDEAIADFDAFLEAEPGYDAYHWRRGIAYYYAGRFEEGAAQFVRHRIVNPDDVENAVWHFLCKANATSVDDARAALLPVGPDQRDPMKELYALFAGRATPQDVLDRASSSRQRDAVFFAHFYLGLYHDALGDSARAREHIEVAATTHGRSHYMGSVARLHATLLGRNPSRSED